ncbi:MAG: long-chain fatty acid--CoA ligase [Candidatus Lokiarchaeota archaeon]|nr:long-chain fatty acid--CoA ligase [Candidatus Lokiarchaeota archaeon]
MTIKYPVDENKAWFKSKYWPPKVPHQLDIDFTMTLGDLLDRAVKNWGDLPFIAFEVGGLNWITYKQFADKVSRLATYLDSIGVKKGDVVAALLPNSIQYAVAYYAATKIGAIISGINPTYKPMEMLHQVKTINAQYLITLDTLFVEIAEPILAKKEWSFKKIIVTNITDDCSGLSPIKKILGKLLKKIPSAKVSHPDAVPYLTTLKTAPNPPKVTINAAEDVATLIMTGGTTGVPKAAMLTHENVVSNAKQCEFLLVNQKENESDPDLGPKTGMMGVLPFFHSFAMTTVMNVSVASGAFIILFPRPPPTEEILHAISTIKLPDGSDPNGICYCGAEILFKRIADLPKETLDQYKLKGRLKLCMSGAGALHEYVRQPFVEKTGARLSEGYGLTESSPVVTVNQFFGECPPGFIGLPVSGTDVMIFDAADFSKGPIKTLGEGGTGEICVAGPQVMKGYLGTKEDNIQEWGGKRWLLTGDIGFMDEHGRFAIRDRKKQLIKMSGHSVFPSEVEELLGHNPKISEVAVAGLPDPKTGEAVKAWVALKAGETATPEELIAWAKENMTDWKVPKYIEIIKEVPKNLIGKVQRRVLQEADPLFKK